MSREYADTKIREALKLCNGNMALARKQIISLAQNDAMLLQALTQPHLDGIVAYQIERVASGRAEIEKRFPDEQPPKKEENFGMELLRAIASSDVQIFGQENTSGGKRKSASRQHIDAIHKIASNRRNKK